MFNWTRIEFSDSGDGRMEDGRGKTLPIMTVEHHKRCHSVADPGILFQLIRGAEAAD